MIDERQRSDFAERLAGVSPADLTRRINAIPMELLALAKAKADGLAAARHIDLKALPPSINRLAKAK